MLNGYRVYDADAHARMSPRMWEELPEEYVSRRPRPVRISDAEGLGFWTAAWLIEGRIRPTPFGPGAQSANMPGMTMEDVEKAAIEGALNDSRGNRRKAATALGIGERTLYRKIKEFGLD